MDSLSDAAPRQLARMASTLYLVNTVGGAFAIGFVRSTLVVAGDAAATAPNIQAHELLHRLGLVAHVVVTVTNIPLAVLFYGLFKLRSSSRRTSTAARSTLFPARSLPPIAGLIGKGTLHQYA